MDCMRNQFVEGAILGGRYTTVAPLNHGSFGMVFSARDIYTGELVAIKCLTKPGAAVGCPSPLSVDDRSEELALHTRIGSHPNIVNLLHHFETDAHNYLVLEFCPNGDLYEAIRLGRGPLETEHVRAFMLQLVDALEHLHAKDIYHRDIKPENIFLTQDGDVKIGDFGLATTDAWSYENAVGSDRYMAPEQYDSNGAGYASPKADIWALGICLLNILFSRNPFAVPTLSDPLYADYVADRQSLFDIFPTMSQDTFEVLVHCLATDPANRSLQAVRDALDRAVSFTTDDESLDDYCTAERDTVPAATTINREPLRTPSITSPPLDHTGSFPWAEALKKSPQRAIAHLPPISDVLSEDLFPAADSDWCSVKPDSASLASAVDSGLGVSIKSSEAAVVDDVSAFRSKPLPISGSLPAPTARSTPFSVLSSIFGKKNEGAVSKSWSDMWDEDFEEATLHPFTVSALDVSTPAPAADEDDEPTLVRPSLTAELRQRSLSHCSESTGRATPRAPFGDVRSPYKTTRQVRSPASGLASALASPRGVEDPHRAHGTRYASPTKSSIMDKWAALGERRRAETLDGASDSEQQQQAQPQQQSLPTVPTSPVRKTRAYVNDWRRNIPFRTVKEPAAPTTEARSRGGLHRYMRKDWRTHDSASSGTATPVASPTVAERRPAPPSLDTAKKTMWQFSRTWTPLLHDDGASPPPSAALHSKVPVDLRTGRDLAQRGSHDIDDIGDLEWVGGWDNLHL